ELVRDWLLALNRFQVSEDRGQMTASDNYQRLQARNADTRHPKPDTRQQLNHRGKHLQKIWEVV
ncbi:MAG: hypothetical protein OEU55_03230, partial [Desulfobacterales bacterium]|nr:hypothetical protein [Desulfobacterales bacterium]